MGHATALTLAALLAACQGLLLPTPPGPGAPTVTAPHLTEPSGAAKSLSVADNSLASLVFPPDVLQYVRTGAVRARAVLVRVCQGV